VPESSLVREADLAFMTRAGPEIGVASTKAFTTQLVAMMLLALVLAQHRNAAVAPIEEAVAALRRLPAELERVLSLDAAVAELAEDIAGCAHALFLGRGVDYPIALEGALKLKEISYIHAEGYAAGELKHGPLALVDEEMPVVAVAANNALLEKLLSNLREVGSRGGRLVVFTGDDVRLPADQAVRVLPIGAAHGPMAPALHVVPLQLLAYHVAVLKGTDVDQPRNLAKSVTVE
jgi:glucosamine--fructose-6-phosphate aminotransferase (isomerizing)